MDLLCQHPTKQKVVSSLPKADVKHGILLVLVEERSDCFILDEMSFLPAKRRYLNPMGVRFRELLIGFEYSRFEEVR